MNDALLVSVVDDDLSIREALPVLLRQLGYEAKAFRSAEEFLGSGCVASTHCLLLDIQMPGMNGPQLHTELKLRHRPISVIFITAHWDDAICSRMLELGAVACLSKPFSDTMLIKALNSTLQRCGATSGNNRVD
ncbi:response regulator [Acidicapsa ligni]|uniref:response regulator n=1 Tax=Acidicapsa ligni TaxID=542300 RepID=UPI0021DF9B22|nr:response regulator [Acidicapsa ligni]